MKKVEKVRDETWKALKLAEFSSPLLESIAKNGFWSTAKGFAETLSD